MAVTGTTQVVKEPTVLGAIGQGAGYLWTCYVSLLDTTDSGPASIVVRLDREQAKKLYAQLNRVLG